jgi:hypothetical protein
MKFICDDYDNKGNPIPNSGCGEITHIIFDGYGFGDKQLEQVMFKASVIDGEVVVDAVDDWDNDNYLKGLNKNHWLGAAKAYQANLDIATCPNCGNDIDAQARES